MLIRSGVFRPTWTEVALSTLGVTSVSTSRSGRGTIYLGPRLPGANLFVAGWPFGTSVAQALYGVDDADRVYRLMIEARDQGLRSSR